MFGFDRQVFIPLWRIFQKEWMYWLPGGFITLLIVSGAQFGTLLPDLTFPYVYDNFFEGDSKFSLWLAQRLNEGWAIDNPRNAYPFDSRTLDFPIADIGSLIVMKAFSLVTDSPAGILNLFYLFAGFLSFSTAYIVSRAFGLKVYFGIVAAVAFSLLPFYFYRYYHILLIYTFTVPLAIYVGYVIFTYLDEKPALAEGVEGWVSKTDGQNSSIKNHLWLGAIILPFCWVLSSFGLYNAVFAMVALLISGIAATFKFLNWRPFAVALVFVLVILTILLINVSPSLIFQVNEGGNPALTTRPLAHTEIFGLKPVQLVLPHEDHRLSMLSNFSKSYKAQFPLVNENHSAALGTLGALGFICVVLGIMWRLSGRELPIQVSFLSILTLALILTATVGGLSSLVAFYTGGIIRSWNRISVLIGFSSILTILFFLNALIRQTIDQKRVKGVEIGLAVILSLFVMWDQIPVRSSDWIKGMRVEFAADASFYNAIEEQLPVNAAVYQFPHISFLGGSSHQLNSYNPLMGFVHTEDIRWSSGAVHGRESDKIFLTIAQAPTPITINILQRLGFSGFTVDRRGYEDNGVALITELNEILGTNAKFAREDGQVLYYDLPNSSNVDFAGLNPTEVLNSVGLSWDSDTKTLSVLN